MKNILYFLLAITIFFGSSSMVYSGGWIIDREGPFKGRIVDAETKEPIEGAVIVAKYFVRTLYPIGWRSDYKDIREALTNERGEFFIPTRTMLISPLSFGDDASFLIWKPGYKPKKISGGYFFAKEPGTIETRPTHTDQGLELKPTRLGIVDLLQMKTMEDRRKAMPIPIGEISDYKKQKDFIRLLNEEARLFGFEPYKQED